MFLLPCYLKSKLLNMIKWPGKGDRKCISPMWWKEKMQQRFRILQAIQKQSHSQKWMWELGLHFSVAEVKWLLIKTVRNLAICQMSCGIFFFLKKSLLAPQNLWISNLFRSKSHFIHWVLLSKICLGFTPSVC